MSFTPTQVTREALRILHHNLNFVGMPTRTVETLPGNIIVFSYEDPDRIIEMCEWVKANTPDAIVLKTHVPVHARFEFSNDVDATKFKLWWV